jgi:hypothetical protein
MLCEVCGSAPTFDNNCYHCTLCGNQLHLDYKKFEAQAVEIGRYTFLDIDHDSGRYQNRSGEKITFQTWLILVTCREYKRIALDKRGEVHISTVWLGLDHVLDEPLFFETMIFPGDIQERYATLEQAVKGHELLVDQHLSKM